MAVNSLSGLPNKFTTRITEFATEFEVEYTVLGAVDDGIDNVEVLRDRVLANVRALSDDQEDTVDEAIDRLVRKADSRVRRRYSSTPVSRYYVFEYGLTRLPVSVSESEYGLR